MLRFAALFLLTFFSPAYAQLTNDARPSLLFSREDIPTLRERIQRPPYDAWWSTVLTRAQNGLPDGAPERTKARLAKTLAFAYRSLREAVNPSPAALRLAVEAQPAQVRVLKCRGGLAPVQPISAVGWQ